MNKSTSSVRPEEVAGYIANGWQVDVEQIQNPLGLVRMSKMINLDAQMAQAARYYRKHGE